MFNDNIAITVEGLSKRYYTPQRHRNRYSKVLGHFKNLGLWGKAREDDYFWALKDVSFEVPRGEILGIMGANGSGKSTLLKLLTGVTPPTAGRAVLRGRVGSLLEVGTGFHPDMSGRENVFMSGILLGIPKSEIRSRFDEIVDFAGLEEFIDVPVKRYSSGMYVRLAYAVASMLDCDILILDEVLAVGDVAFQEKAQKNMESLTKQGRTILFVSHNPRLLAAVCRSGMLLREGQLVYEGDIRSSIQGYLTHIHSLDSLGSLPMPENDISASPRLYPPGTGTLRKASLHDAQGNPATKFKTGDDMLVRITYSGCGVSFPCFGVFGVNAWGERVFSIDSTHPEESINFPENGVVECVIHDLRLGEGAYTLMIDYASCTGNAASYRSMDCVPAAIRFEVELGGFVCGTGCGSAQGAPHQSAWRLLG